MLGTARSAAEQHRESVAQTQIGMSARPGPFGDGRGARPPRRLASSSGRHIAREPCANDLATVRFSVVLAVTRTEYFPDEPVRGPVVQAGCPQPNASWAARTPLFRLTSLSSPGAATRSPTI